MEFEKEPNYSYLRKLLRQVLKKSKFSIDYKFEWTPLFVAAEEMIPKNDKPQQENEKEEETKEALAANTLE